MMRFTLIPALLLLFFTASAQQEFQGVATYQTASSIKFDTDSSKAPPERQKFFQEMMAKALQGEFELNFDRTSSIYQEIQTLEEDAGGGSGGGRRRGGGMRLMIGSLTGGSSIFYKNTREQSLTEQTEFFGKRFLIKDSLESFNWQLQNETKQVGVYTCYKATTTRMVRLATFTRKSGGQTKTDTVVEQTVTAWYTPQIPVNHGPRGYWGLPGLILELSDGTKTMVCSKVVLNPKNKVKIEEPEEGDEVTDKEYAEIITKKTEEISKVYGGRGGRGRRGPGGPGGGGGTSSFTIEMRY